MAKPFHDYWRNGHVLSLSRVLTLCNPMGCSTPAFPALHYLPELAQSHIPWVTDAIQPSHHLSSPSPPAFNLSQHQGLFQWVGSLHHVAKVLGASTPASVLPMNIQSWFPLGLTGLISLLSKGLSAPHFTSFNSMALSLPSVPTLTSAYDYWKNHSFDYADLCQESDVSAF